MSNTHVNHKNLRRSNAGVSMWIRLAEDAENDIAKAKQRIRQLADAARIFRHNGESGIPFPKAGSSRGIFGQNN